MIKIDPPPESTPESVWVYEQLLKIADAFNRLQEQLEENLNGN
jgi:hypothetical protein